MSTFEEPLPPEDINFVFGLLIRKARSPGCSLFLWSGYEGTSGICSRIFPADRSCLILHGALRRGRSFRYA